MHGAHAVPMGRRCGPVPAGLEWVAMAAGHHRGRGRGFGGPPMAGFGGGGPGRRRRGDVRAAVLVLLAEEPRNGYGLMQEIEERSGGTWRPSPGSIYPTLQQLEDEGLVVAADADGRKLWQLTDAGRTHVEERREQLGTPWEPADGGSVEDAVSLRKTMHQLVTALRQVLHEGDPAQIASAREILTDARRRLYRLLADELPGDESAGDR